MSTIELLNETTPRKKQFILKCYNRKENFTIHGFLQSIGVFGSSWLVTSGYIKTKTKPLMFAYICAYGSSFSYGKWYIIYDENSVSDSFKIEQLIILPSRTEIQSKLVQDADLSRNIIHKIVQIYL